LEDGALQLALFGHAIAGEAAALSNTVLHWDRSWRAPWLGAGNALINGIHAKLCPEDFARLAFYGASMGLSESAAEIVANGQTRRCALFTGQAAADAHRWDLSDWQRDWQELTTRAVTELIKSYADVPKDQARLVMSQIMVRVSSTLRAQANPTPMRLRHGFTRADVQIESERRPYLDFFQIDEQHLTFKRFDGSQSAPVKRAAFVSGDAVTVLPYDAKRDRVLLIEQFRAAPFVRGDQHPWSVEVIAGRIDAGETPKVAALREAAEETGLCLRALEPIASYYPSPGAVAEYLYSYVGLVDLPDDAARIGGLETEAEDIRGILLSFDELMAFIGSGEAENGPLILSAYWLAANRERLRTGA